MTASTTGQVLKSRAAVAFAAGEPLKIVEIDVAPPKAGEVRIRITQGADSYMDLLVETIEQR